jgi:hypothetical protein
MALDNTVVVLIVICAAGACVLVGFATTRYFTSNDTVVNLQEPGEGSTQAQYMREVRLRNQEKLGYEYGHGQHALVKNIFLYIPGVTATDRSITGRDAGESPLRCAICDNHLMCGMLRKRPVDKPSKSRSRNHTGKSWTSF